MGDYVIKKSRGVKDADEVQQHYHRIIAPDLAEEPGAARTAEIILGTIMRTGIRYFDLANVEKANRDRDTEIVFLTNAKKDSQLKQKGWLKMIDERLGKLQSE